LTMEKGSESYKGSFNEAWKDDIDATKAGAGSNLRTTLKLSKNKVGPKGAQVLAEALKTNSNLTTLDLQFSSIGPSGAQALTEALKTNSTLTTLDLQSNSIGPNGAQAVMDMVISN
ncbi:hypothetical protein BGZ97_009988, partial [Linnemannia gamsii]